ncbi:protein kinase domain-containing protein [Streptomyces sp. 7N604]|uniref:protein kinase domain-containing protein n=1 Tax=Streptomyces sp. 7N604 TaxID=3457415 RepID=UPI003FD5190A
MEELRAEDPQWIGAYRLLGRLGAGGMGCVYLARSERGRTVAVKLVQAELARQSDFRRRFAHEVEAARRVGGRWTAPVLDADTEADTPWVATGYIGGPSLQSVVAEDFGPLPEHSVRILADGLAHALRDIHAAGLVHRDLKPSNILVTIDGPRVIDFGIARATETLAGGGLTMTGAVVGSPGFMSPEQVRGERVTTASDLFCLGSVLAFAATGRQPFGTANSGLHALMYRIAQEEPDLTGLPDGLMDLVLGCLAKEPGQRLTVDQVLERTGGAAGAGAGDEPWLPGGLLARLGRDALQLLETENPQTSRLARTGAAPAAPATVPAPGTAGPATGLGRAPEATPSPAPGATPSAAPGSAPNPAASPAPGSMLQPSTPPPPAAAFSTKKTPAPGPSTPPPPAATAQPWGNGTAAFGPAPAPAPGPAPYQPQPRPPAVWQPLRGLATALSILLALSLVFALIDLLLSFSLYGTYERGLSWEIADRRDSVDAVGIFGGLTSLTAVVLWLVWFRRLAVNTELIAPGRQRFSRGWAVGSWFTPIVQLWFPKQMANDIWSAVVPSHPVPGPYGGPAAVPSRSLLSWWWGMYCTMFVTGFLATLVEIAATTNDDYKAATAWTILFDFAALMAGILALAVIQRLTSLQEQRAPRRPY